MKKSASTFLRFNGLGTAKLSVKTALQVEKPQAFRVLRRRIAARIRKLFPTTSRASAKAAAETLIAGAVLAINQPSLAKKATDRKRLVASAFQLKHALATMTEHTLH